MRCTEPGDLAHRSDRNRLSALQVWNLFDSWLGERVWGGTGASSGAMGSAASDLCMASKDVPALQAPWQAARSCVPTLRLRLPASIAGTESVAGNVGSVLIGLSVVLLFRIFKLPLAEFW